MPNLSVKPLQAMIVVKRIELKVNLDKWKVAFCKMHHIWTVAIYGYVATT